MIHGRPKSKNCELIDEFSGGKEQFLLLLRSIVDEDDELCMKALMHHLTGRPSEDERPIVTDE